VTTQRTDASARSRHHSLSAEQFTALAGGGGDEDALAELVASQRSKHLILLSKVAALARRGDHPDDELGVAGSQLLAQVQRQDPATAADVIAYPSVGAWALHVIRGSEIRDIAAPASAALPEVRPSGLAAIAAAAAIKAGLDTEIEVPVLGAGVLLPSLGAAEAAGGSATVATSFAGLGENGTGEAEIRSGNPRAQRRVRTKPGSSGWRELRRAQAGSLDAVIDDLDPFRMPAADGAPTDRLTANQAAEFSHSLRSAWPVLSSVRAAEVSAIVRVIVPWRPPESGHVSISSPQVFGTVAMSRQPDRYSCAETLVHETQHLKLCAVLDLVSLTRPDDGQRYYAPWRPDPRPAIGLLQGAYAYLGVSGFWREQRHAAPEPEVRQRGHAEFARWRDGAATVARTLLDSGQLTGAGVTFVETMAQVLDEWRRERIPGDAVSVARDKSDRHLAQWHADNQQADNG
jgi:uncharacterized protein